jgi:hypothetical protein
VTTVVKDKLASTESLGVGVPSAGPWIGREPAPSAPTRYYFNLTDGDDMIRDEEGIEASSIQAAVVSAMEAVEEHRQTIGEGRVIRGVRRFRRMRALASSRQFPNLWERLRHPAA